MFMSPVERSFKHKWMLRILSLLPVVVFLLITWAVYADEKKVDEFWIMFDLFWAAFAILIWYVAGKIHLDFHAEGFVYYPAFGEPKEFTWNDIVETRYAQNNLNYAVHFGLIGLLMAAAAKNSDSSQKQLTLKVVTGDKRKISLTSNFKDVDDAIRIILGKVNPRFYADAAKELQYKGSVQFGDVTVTQEGVQWKKKDLIPYTKFKKFMIDGNNLRLQAEGKWLDAISVNCEKVPNVFVLIDLVNSTRNGGKPAIDPIAVANDNAFQGSSFKS
jgi:hypothetical protein